MATRDPFTRALRAGTTAARRDGTLDTLPDRAAASALADAQRHHLPTAGLARALADYQETYLDSAEAALDAPFGAIKRTK